MTIRHTITATTRLARSGRRSRVKCHYVDITKIRVFWTCQAWALTIATLRPLTLTKIAFKPFGLKVRRRNVIFYKQKALSNSERNFVYESRKCIKHVLTVRTFQRRPAIDKIYVGTNLSDISPLEDS